MKYIRTKDRIIDLTSKQVSSYEIIDDKTAVDEYGEDSGFIMVYYYSQDVGEHIEYDNKGGHSMDNWYLKDIIKQADTIEELCDAIIYFEDDGKPETTKYFGNMTTFKDKIEFLKKMGHKDFKLGIWTNKGLIYKAKMNEKGELELI